MLSDCKLQTEDCKLARDEQVAVLNQQFAIWQLSSGMKWSVRKGKGEKRENGKGKRLLV
jgi:hypothetical protein